MGFFAAELADILDRHRKADEATPWEVLARMGIHPIQIERLQQAEIEFDHVASLPAQSMQNIRQELGLSALEWARLQSGLDADTFLRLLLYHNYPIEEAANKANAVFAAALKDRLATGSHAESIFVPGSLQPVEVKEKPLRRTRHKHVESPLPSSG